LVSKIVVSIIIPVYNVESYLERCLNSVINQTEKNIEIICIDDGSTDNSLNILKSYENKDKRIKVFFQENRGAGFSRNRGIDIAQGKFIYFLDSDDWLEEDAIENLLINIRSNNAEVTLFNALVHYPNNRFEEIIYLPINNETNYSNFTFDYHYDNNLVMNYMHQAFIKFYRTSFIKDKNLRFYNCEVNNDVQFHIETILKAKKISYLPKILYHYNKMNKNSLQSVKVRTKEGFKIFYLFDDIKKWLIQNKFYSELEINYIKYLLSKTEIRLNMTFISNKRELFKLIKQYFKKINLSPSILREITKKNQIFYKRVLYCHSYTEYKKFRNFIKRKNNLKIIKQKNKKTINDRKTDIKYFMNNISFYNNLIDKIKKYNLFDEKFYIENYHYQGNLNPLIHYIFEGYKKGYKPNAIFDSKFYSSFNKNVNNSGLDPFFYFVLYGMDEGIIKINKNISQPSSINKIKISKKIRKFNDIGINKTEIRNPRIIVSLTSFPERMYDIHYSLYSLLTQELKPDKLILWLAKSQFPNKEKDIPVTVLNLKENGLEINWCDDFKSYLKLLPSLKLYPKDIIVTVDDDIFYPSYLLKNLYDNYLKYPQCIISNRARKILVNGDNTFKSYNKWPLIKNATAPSYLNFPTGVGGVLYPPNSLNEKVLNYSLAKELTPNSDDIWFWVMAILKKIKIKVANNNLYELTYVNPARQYNLINEKTLYHSNIKENDKQLKNIVNYFPEIFDIINEVRSNE